MLNRPVEPQPVKKMRPSFSSASTSVSLICVARPEATNSRNLRSTSASTSNSSLSAAAMSRSATSLKFAVTGCEDSVTSAPSLNCPLTLKKSSDRCDQVLFIGKDLMRLSAHCHADCKRAKQEHFPVSQKRIS